MQIVLLKSLLYSNVALTSYHRSFHGMNKWGFQHGLVKVEDYIIFPKVLYVYA